MGKRDEVCVTYDPGAQPAEEFAERLREHLTRDPREIPADISEPERTEFDDVDVLVGSESDAAFAVDDHVYAFGVTWSTSEHRDWRTVLRSFPQECQECDWFLDIYTQEAGYMGHGNRFHLVDGEYVHVDEYHTTEGGYDDELIEYFVVEHDIRPLTYSHMRLD